MNICRRLICLDFIFHFEFERFGTAIGYRPLAREQSDPKPDEGRNSTVVAWLRARTVKSPHPDFTDVDVPLHTVCERRNCPPDGAGVEWSRVGPAGDPPVLPAGRARNGLTYSQDMRPAPREDRYP